MAKMIAEQNHCQMASFFQPNVKNEIAALFSSKMSLKMSILDKKNALNGKNDFDFLDHFRAKTSFFYNRQNKWFRNGSFGLKNDESVFDFGGFWLIFWWYCNEKVLRVVSPSLIIYSQFSTVLMDEHCLKVKKLVWWWILIAPCQIDQNREKI